jgi:hypothetical protein
MQFNSGEELCKYISEATDGKTLLSFSGGKDSIGAWLQLRRYFPEITPVFMYLIPGLSFVEESLSYFEDYFGTRIIRMPHPSLYRMRHPDIPGPGKLRCDRGEAALGVRL